MRWITPFLTAFLLLGAPRAVEAQLAQKPALTLDAARAVAAAAREHAAAQGWTLVLAVVDDGGHPLLLERMDGAQLGSVDVALEKAYSAVAFRRPTSAIAGWVHGGDMSVLRLRGAVPLAGGVPLVVGGVVVGALGASGAMPDQDEQAAEAGVAALEALVGHGR